MESPEPGTPPRPTAEDGASMVEYAFLLAGVALVVAVAAEVFGTAVFDAFLLPLAWL